MQTFLTLLVLALAFIQADAGRDALRLGRTSDQALYDAFNAGYHLAGSTTVSNAEVITEFRRAVMIVREHANQGEYGFTERDLERAMAPYRGLVTIIVEVRLNPLNTYIKAPPYNLDLRTGPATKPLAPRNFERSAEFGVPMASPGTPLIGVRLQGTFAVADIDAAAAPTIVVVDDKGDIMWTARLDLSRFR
jgi:hypothetical protein